MDITLRYFPAPFLTPCALCEETRGLDGCDINGCEDCGIGGPCLFTQPAGVYWARGDAYVCETCCYREAPALWQRVLDEEIEEWLDSGPIPGLTD
jgi:hypothetical protein